MLTDASVIKECRVMMTDGKEPAEVWEKGAPVRERDRRLAPHSLHAPCWLLGFPVLRSVRHSLTSLTLSLTGVGPLQVLIGCSVIVT